MNDPIIRTARQVGADVLHGIESHGALSFEIMPSLHYAAEEIRASGEEG